MVVSKKKVTKKVTKKAKPKPKVQANPLWLGPAVDGVTQSMLARFLNCRERFRVRTLLGLGEADSFRVPIEYGNYWHEAEEAVAQNKSWEAAMDEYRMVLMNHYPMQQEQALHWYNVAQLQFPIYLEYWAKNRDVQEREPLLSEQEFEVEYHGTILRGKWDSVDIVDDQLVLQENKTKASVDEGSIGAQLSWDLQTLTYLTALRTARDNGMYDLPPLPIRGIRYNVVRRPLGGGRHSIRQHKATKNKLAETLNEFYNRLAKLITEDADYFFMRWDVPVLKSDIETFERQFLSPVLTQLQHWYDWCIENWEDPFAYCGKARAHGGGLHWRHPYGLYNPTNEGIIGEVEAFMDSGSSVGLHPVKDLYPELEYTRAPSK